MLRFLPETVFALILALLAARAHAANKSDRIVECYANTIDAKSGIVIQNDFAKFAKEQVQTEQLIRINDENYLISFRNALNADEPFSFEISSRSGESYTSYPGTDDGWTVELRELIRTDKTASLVACKRIPQF